MLLVRDIAAAAEATDLMSLDMFCALTLIRGRRNPHLAEADGFDNSNLGYHERRAPLPLDGEVHGEFLTVDYCGHGPWAMLEDHESLEAVEKRILSGAGVLNGFTDFVLAFVNGKQRDYEVHDESARLLVRNGMRLAEWDLVHAADPTKCRVIWNDG